MMWKSATSVLNIKNRKTKTENTSQKNAPNNNNSIKPSTKTSKQPTSVINLFLNLFPKGSELILQPYTADWYLSHSTDTVSSDSEAVFWRVPRECFKRSELPVFYLLANGVMSHMNL